MGSGRGWLAGDWPSTGAFSTLLRQSGLRASTGGVLATKSERKMLVSTCLYSLYAWFILWLSDFSSNVGTRQRQTVTKRRLLLPTDAARDANIRTDLTKARKTFYLLFYVGCRDTLTTCHMSARHVVCQKHRRTIFQYRSMCLRLKL